MAKRLEYDIVTDPSKGIAGLKQFSAAAKKAMADVEGSFDDTTTSAQKVAKALSGLADELETEMKGAAKAADALGRALGPELAGRANTDQIVQDLHKMGLSFDEITADADSLAASVKKLDGVQMGGLQQSTARTKKGFSDVVDGADQSRNAIANLVGNSSQDLGQLAGVTGSAGVAVGQLAEFFTDASFQAKQAGQGIGAIIKSFAGAAVPIAGLSVGVALLTNAWESYQETQKKIDERNKATIAALQEQLGLTDKLTKSYEDATDTFGLFVSTMDDEAIDKSNKSLGEIGKTVADLDGIVKGFTLDPVAEAARLLADVGVPRDLIPKLSEIIGKYDDWKDIDFKIAQQFSRNQEKRVRGFEKQIKAIEELNDQQENLINNDVARQFLLEAAAAGDAEKAIVAQAVATNTAADGQVDWKKALVDAVPELEKQSRAVEELTKRIDENAKKIDDTIDALKSWGAGFEDVTKGAVDLQGTVDEMAGTFESMARRDDALSAIFDLGNAPLDALEATQDINDAIRELGEFIREEGVPNIFDPNDVDASAFLGKFSDLRDKVQAKVTEAFAAGGPEAARQVADGYVTQITKSLKGKLTEDDVRNLLGVVDIQGKLKVEADLQSLGEAKTLIDGLNQIDPLLALQLGVDLDAKTITPQAAKQVIDDVLKNVGTAGIPTAMIAPDQAGLDAARQGANDFYVRNPAIIGTKTTTPTNLGKTLTDTQRALDQNPLTVTVLASLRRAFQTFDAGGTVSGGGGIVGERRPEIVNGRWLATQPTVVPAGTRVTSGARTARILRTRGTRGLKRYDAGGVVTAGNKTVNINVNTAVMGNRFDVMRAVRRASLDAERMLGTRG